MPHIIKTRGKGGWPKERKRHSDAAKLGHDRKKGSMFYKDARFKYLGKIVRMDTPKNARESTKQLESEFNKAKTSQKRLRIFRATVLAKNRADAQLKRKNLSPPERKEFKQISQIYGNSAKRMKL